MDGHRRLSGIGLPLAALLCLMIAASVIEAPTGAPAGAAADLVASPIRHIVVIDEENHSFDNLLGDFCVRVARGKIVRDGSNDPCVGTNKGVLSDGTSFVMKETPDAGISVAHGESPQIQALDGGKMDGFSNMPGCGPDSPTPYACLTQFHARSGTCGKGGNRSC